MTWEDAKIGNEGVLGLGAMELEEGIFFWEFLVGLGERIYVGEELEEGIFFWGFLVELGERIYF